MHHREVMILFLVSRNDVYRPREPIARQQYLRSWNSLHRVVYRAAHSLKHFSCSNPLGFSTQTHFLLQKVEHSTAGQRSGLPVVKTGENQQIRRESPPHKTQHHNQRTSVRNRWNKINSCRVTWICSRHCSSTSSPSWRWPCSNSSNKKATTAITNSRPCRLRPRTRLCPRAQRPRKSWTCLTLSPR